MERKAGHMFEANVSSFCRKVNVITSAHTYEGMVVNHHMTHHRFVLLRQNRYPSLINTSATELLQTGDSNHIVLCV